ncbi:TetR/AcrR family transcriptional regulator [Neorhizobium sp. DAR64872/K0K18]|uniref:TetR/AcrR family transcriptional regulator n=1 Tax=Neorhizobium sp. DAR64872/K0K18 TaxID=3421958 RepID=UPI003D28DE9F
MQASEAGQVRGRPRAFDREAVLGRAMRLFWERGYAATSISDLTEAMGIGAPSLYATFGSKALLYAEAIEQYQKQYENWTWSGFLTAPTARAAVERLLMDSAAVLTGSCSEGDPLGCMVTLSAVQNEGQAHLGDLVIAARNRSLMRLKDRLSAAVVGEEIDAAVDIPALARYIVTVQNGMSIQARDGASRSELEAVARMAMVGWDAQTRPS